MSEDVELPNATEPYAEPRASQLPEKAKMPISALETRAVRMRLGEIKKEHFLVTDLERELELPFFAGPPSERVPATWVSALLERMPLMVRQDRSGEVACIGDIQLYRLARVVLSPDDIVPVFRDAGSLIPRRKQRLREGLLAETFLLPAVFGRRAEEIRALELAWARVSQPEQTKVDIAGLYRSGTARPRQRRQRG